MTEVPPMLSVRSFALLLALSISNHIRAAEPAKKYRTALIMCATVSTILTSARIVS